MGSGKSLIIGLFAVIAGATLGIGGAVALMLMELNRYSPAGEILVTMGAFATGLALIMLGLNLLIKQIVIPLNCWMIIKLDKLCLMFLH